MSDTSYEWRGCSRVGANLKVVRKIMMSACRANEPTSHHRIDECSSTILDETPNEMRLAEPACVIGERAIMRRF
ncbi:MAG: hypothetical protein NPIRA02_34980 [Nitrospirales bacterium]|nr:MAG: hypothetical protein NPIRA02_34980 [Nitrospirales bacterium]